MSPRKILAGAFLLLGLASAAVFSQDWAGDVDIGSLDIAQVRADYSLWTLLSASVAKGANAKSKVQVEAYYINPITYVHLRGSENGVLKSPEQLKAEIKQVFDAYSLVYVLLKTPDDEKLIAGEDWKFLIVTLGNTEFAPRESNRPAQSWSSDTAAHSTKPRFCCSSTSSRGAPREPSMSPRETTWSPRTRLAGSSRKPSGLREPGPPGPQPRIPGRSSPSRSSSACCSFCWRRLSSLLVPAKHGTGRRPEPTERAHERDFGLPERGAHSEELRGSAACTCACATKCTAARRNGRGIIPC